MLSGFFLLGSDWKVAFGAYPDQYFQHFPAGLNPAWSLGVEIGFYLLAPFLLRSRAAVLCVLAISVMTRLALYQTFGLHTTWTYTFFPSAVFFFLIGHFSYRLYATYPAYPGLHTVSQQWNWLLLPLAAAFMLTGLTAPFDSVPFYGAVICFALSLPSVFHLTKDNRFLNFLGNLSYPVYLIHALCLVFFSTRALDLAKTLFAKDASIAQAASAITVGGILIIAVFCHLLVEKPCARLMRGFIRWLEKQVQNWRGMRVRSVKAPIPL